MEKPLLAVTMGDPAGVGPEICLSLLANSAITAECTPVVFGDAVILSRVAEAIGQSFETPVFAHREWASAYSQITEPSVCDLALPDTAQIQPGTVDARTGSAGYAYINAAIDAALAGHVAAVATAPLHKEALSAAGVKYPGHTEIFAARTGATRSCMMQYSEEITCTFVTVHVGYAEVPKLLTQQRIEEVIDLTAEALMRIRGRKPRLGVCGLNPHAGEHGLFGDREEERMILPAIEAARKRGIQIEGPLPPDTAFLPWKRRALDAIVCMYHDQGHIPVKALAFDCAVNTTLGLPIIRTSVDHGTALDIAWQDKANPSSLFHAVRLTCRLARSG